MAGAIRGVVVRQMKAGPEKYTPAEPLFNYIGLTGEGGGRKTRDEQTNNDFRW